MDLLGGIVVQIALLLSQGSHYLQYCLNQIFNQSSPPNLEAYLWGRSLLGMNYLFIVLALVVVAVIMSLTIMLSMMWWQMLTPKPWQFRSAAIILLWLLCMPPVGFVLLVQLIVRHVKWKWMKTTLEWSREVRVSQFVLDADDLGSDPSLPMVVENGVERVRGCDEALPADFVPNRHYIGWLCREAKAHFGCPKRTEANFQMVRRWVRDQMKMRNMRVTHMAQQLPLVVSYVFIPSKEEIFARDMFMSIVASERKGQYEQVYYDSEGRILPDAYSAE